MEKTIITVLDHGDDYDYFSPTKKVTDELFRKFLLEKNALFFWFYNKTEEYDQYVSFSVFLDNSEIVNVLEEVFDTKVRTKLSMKFFRIKDMTRERFFELLSTKFEVVTRNV